MWIVHPSPSLASVSDYSLSLFERASASIANGEVPLPEEVARLVQITLL